METENPRSSSTSSTLGACGGRPGGTEVVSVIDVSPPDNLCKEKWENLQGWYNRMGQEMAFEGILYFDQCLRLGAVPSASDFSEEDSDDELDGCESERLERARIEFQFD